MTGRRGDEGQEDLELYSYREEPAVGQIIVEVTIDTGVNNLCFPLLTRR